MYVLGYTYSYSEFYLLLLLCLQKKAHRAEQLHALRHHPHHHAAAAASAAHTHHSHYSSMPLHVTQPWFHSHISREHAVHAIHHTGMINGCVRGAMRLFVCGAPLLCLRLSCSNENNDYYCVYIVISYSR